MKRIFIIALLFVGCNRDLSDDPIPYNNFPPLVLSLGFPENIKLAVDGGYRVIGAIGVRGVIVYRTNSTTYQAFEVNCSYHPNEAASNVSVHTSGLYMVCTGCNSTFNFTGQPTGGIAWRPLRRYRTELVGSNLTITSDVLN
ncbi:MAG TPA: hypothetical protein PKM91_15635 [Cyclobacteriaceae bacterium]|nr:hypothetical protein [Cytophagales bacterium]HNP78673.1 hypothetical protein [Cyclobacteriaceae bacterium]